MRNLCFLPLFAPLVIALGVCGCTSAADFAVPGISGPGLGQTPDFAPGTQNFEQLITSPAPALSNASPPLVSQRAPANAAIVETTPLATPSRPCGDHLLERRADAAETGRLEPLGTGDDRGLGVDRPAESVPAVGPSPSIEPANDPCAIGPMPSSDASAAQDIAASQAPAVAAPQANRRADRAGKV
jgi:hypothetical protein